jgi:hypothetical protein
MTDARPIASIVHPIAPPISSVTDMRRVYAAPASGRLA